jgi:hypothetical protein
VTWFPEALVTVAELAPSVMAPEKLWVPKPPTPMAKVAPFPSVMSPAFVFTESDPIPRLSVPAFTFTGPSKSMSGVIRESPAPCLTTVEPGWLANCPAPPEPPMSWSSANWKIEPERLSNRPLPVTLRPSASSTAGAVDSLCSVPVPDTPLLPDPWKSSVAAGATVAVPVPVKAPADQLSSSDIE